MKCRLFLGLALVSASGCAITADEVLHTLVLPEQRALQLRDPADLPRAPVPSMPPPRTVSDPQPDTKEYKLSLDDALRIALSNSRVVRVLAGSGASSSGRTIYDTAITNTTIDQERARFDPNVTQQSTFTRTETPVAVSDPRDPSNSVILGTTTDGFRAVTGVSQTNVLGGQFSLNAVDNPVRVGGDFNGDGSPLNPRNNSSLELNYTQPLLQGGGFAVNTAPITLARLDTERSFFQYKDSVQELVRGVIEGYWNLVFSRVDLFARKTQVEQSEEAYKRERARKEAGFASAADVAQARVTLTQFRANLIAAQANVLSQEGVLRNLLGLPASDRRVLVPVSPPAAKRLSPKWDELVKLAEQRRPDLVELKLVLESDSVRLLQAENAALPQLNAIAQYRYNGLAGDAPNGRRIESAPGQFTDWSLGVNFAVPLGLRQGRAQVRQQSLLMARDKANLDQGLHAIVHELAVTVRELASAYEQYEALREARAAAYENLQVQQEVFRTARQTIFLTVLQALNDFGNTVSAEARALTNYNVLLATLERQTGTILETHGLIFAEERFQAPGPLGLPGHRKAYPSAVRPAGEPRRYPGGTEPAENSFDLRSPTRDDKKSRPETMEKGLDAALGRP